MTFILPENNAKRRRRLITHNAMELVANIIRKTTTKDINIVHSILKLQRDYLGMGILTNFVDNILPFGNKITDS